MSFKNNEGMKEFISSYFSWMSGLKENSKSIVAYVSKLEWLPKE